MKSRCSAFCCVIDHFRDNAFGQESDTGEADPYILHPMSAAFVGSTNIYLIHKIMQDCRCQFRQFWVFLCSADELLDAFRFFFLLGNLLFPKLHLFRQFCLLLLVISKNNALSELLDKLIKKDRLVKVDAKTLLPEIVFARQSDFAFDGNLTGKHIVCREDVFNDYFMADIHSFKKRLIVYSAFMTEARLSTLLPVFSDAVRAGKQIIVVTKALSDRGKSELAQYQKCEKELRDIGVSVLHKKGMHEKLIFVDSNAVWIGSLNALSFTGLTGEVMQRYADRELTAEYEKLFDIEHICNAIENTYEQKCPICGDEMIVKESDEGGIYWQCVAGDYSRNVAQQYPLDGILRCKCGAPYVFAMKNEPRWVCSEDSRHYQKMRESDLRLEKMAALIPTKAARSQVNKYFFAKKKEIEAKKKATAPKKTSATKKARSASEDEDDSKQMKMF